MLGYCYTIECECPNTGKIDKTQVYVTGRPRKAHGELVLGPALSVTDTFVAVDEVPFVWVPWNECRKPTPELYYAVNKILYQWIDLEKKEKVHVFCDAGTHRSPSVFGSYLISHHPDEAQRIVSERFHIERGEDRGEANPIKYAESYLKEFPEDRLFLKILGEDKLIRMDAATDLLVRRIATRYGPQLAF